MKNQLKILILENNQAQIDLLQNTLMNSDLNCTIEVSQKLPDSKKNVNNFHPDLVLSNYNLFLLNERNISSSEKKMNPSIPLIIVSDEFQKEELGELDGKKFSDIVSKNELHYLVPKIKKAIQNVVELKDKNKDTKEFEALKKEFELFSSFLSHDLRAPLRAINGYMKMIEEDKKHLTEEECQRIVTIVHSNAKKATVLMDDLLAFSRITTRELNVNLINTSELVQEVISDIKSTLQLEAKIIVHDLDNMTGDFSVIYLMFTHLISNAIKFSSKMKDSLIEISSKKEKDQIIYSVKDNGIGLGKESIEKLFTTFNRFHDPAEYDGTGMGLAIVYRIVTKHNGKVWMESEPNKGATVFCSFPNKM